MYLFYTSEIRGTIYQLSKDESKHCISVLRLAEGDTVYLTDGQGVLYTTRIMVASAQACSVEIIGKQENYGKRNYKLHLAVAPTKNMERFEWLLEKITEIGVDEITPLLCEHSVRRNLKHERAMKILIAAMKQSFKAQLPILHEMSNILTFVKRDSTGKKIIAHCHSGEKTYLPCALQGCRDALILIGPEGDFSPDEVNLALTHGFEAVTLGDTRLRVETAGFMACCQMQTMNSL